MIMQDATSYTPLRHQLESAATHMADTLKQYKILFQEVINCSLRDYATGSLSEEELQAWLSDTEALHIYATYLEISPAELKEYLEDRIQIIVSEKGILHG